MGASRAARLFALAALALPSSGCFTWLNLDRLERRRGPERVLTALVGGDQARASDAAASR